MKKILSIDIIDIIPYAKGVLFVRKENLDDDNIKVTFFAYDIAENTISPVSKNIYLLNKLGPAYEPISAQLGDYASCDAGILPDRSVFVIYPGGEIGLFGKDGSLLSTGDLIYHDEPASGVAVENNHVWCTVPKLNSIIRFSVESNKVVMRMGSPTTPTFNEPVCATLVNGKIFVCCRKDCSIKVIDLKNYSISDYLRFDEPVHKYIVSCGKEFVVLSSGTYMI